MSETDRQAFGRWMLEATFQSLGDDWHWAAWQAGVAAERSRIASLLRQRGAEELARVVEGGE